MNKYLGIDYGLAHIGLATAEAVLATPLESLKNDERLMIRLAELTKREGITHIICGIPEGQLAPIIHQFAQDLEKQTGLSVITHPETLSTQEALHKLRAGGASRHKRQNDHAYAACLILEDYLELTK